MVSDWNIAVGIYQNSQTAQSVLNSLKNKGLKKSTSISNSHEGIISVFSHWLCGVDQEIVDSFKRKIIRDETLILVQIKNRDISRTLKILRDVESGHPATFVFLSDQKFSPLNQEAIPREAVSLENLGEKAALLATQLQPVDIYNNTFHYNLFDNLDQSAKTLFLIGQRIGWETTTHASSAEWLLDNTHILEGTIKEVRKNLTKEYYTTLPKLTSGAYAPLPRIYAIAKELIFLTANRLTQENIVNFIKNYQTVNQLTMGELWALPLMLRLRLIECLKYLAIRLDKRLQEQELASFWGNRILNMARREPERLPAIIEELSREQKIPSKHFAEELIDHLFDDETVLPFVNKWLESILGNDIPKILLEEQIEKTAEDVTFSNSMQSLIFLSKLTWRNIFESTNAIDILLSNDPVGIYTKMDFNTRDSYRHSIETIARRSKKLETDIANTTLQLALEGQDEVTRHIGYYLIDKGRPLLEKEVNCQPSLYQSLRRFMITHPATIYLLSMSLVTILTEIFLIYCSYHLGASLEETCVLTLIALLPVSEFSIQLTNTFLSYALPPFTLPKLFFEKSIPEKYMTLVVIPMMLSAKEAIEDLLHKLEIHFLANSDPSLRFSLFSDFTDASEKTTANDEFLLSIAVSGIENLNIKYGAGKFFLFHRPRLWSESEQAWIGWERKRGKLECLNAFLLGEDTCGDILFSGTKDALKGIKYVITLDADTDLPKDKAKKLIETLAHPLNAPILSKDGFMERGYTIIQPRVGTKISQVKKTLFCKAFSDITVVDPYTQAVSDVYQDLMREGTYHGKGIYDLQHFHKLLKGRFPDEQILSHDLLEGAYVRVGFASDISLFDSFPDDYLTWSKRQHRWIRGDWQIIEWLLPWVPTGNKSYEKNPLSLVNRWKIFDNLRRSLIPITLLGLLATAWFYSTHPALWTLFATVVLFLPTIVMIFFQGIFTWPIADTTISQLWKSFLRSFFNGAVLPQQALISVDAIFRVLYRRFISHHHLLEWSTGAQVSANEKVSFLNKMGLISLFSAAMIALLSYYRVDNVIYALPFAISWMLLPALIYIIDRKLPPKKDYNIPPKDQIFLRQVARQTWRYFDDFVGPQTNWLPPDNYQAALTIEIAFRTSPTNIGLWTLAVVTAWDLKFITADDAFDRISETLKTIKKLELYEGHILNWYDIKTLKPLYPRYVSTVDNGNLLASLWTLEISIKEMLDAPLLPYYWYEGLKISLDLLGSSTGKDFSQLSNLLPRIDLKQTPSIDTTIKLIKLFKEKIEHLPNEENDEGAYWLAKTKQLINDWDSTINRYFSWVEPFCKIPNADLLKLNSNAVEWKNKILTATYTLANLAEGELPVEFTNFLEVKDHSNFEWLKKFQDDIHTSLWLAQEKCFQAKEIISSIRSIADQTNMQFLYNDEKKLFTIGFNVDDCKKDSSYYDLLASEARIASLVAIAKGDVPVDHWWALGRPYGLDDGRHVLLSWGGTMFEYLMPLLFNKFYPESLLGNACYNAVECQKNYAKKLGIPWGISESAYSEIDINKTYQYRSFGVPGLGLKRGLEEDLVVSPYSTGLALMIDPKEAIKNLKRLKNSNLRMLSSFGYYESIDFARQHSPHGERGVIVYAYMGHHQCMSLLSINNVLNNHTLSRRFHSDPRISGVESLLYERIPLQPTVTRSYQQEIPVARLKPFSIVPIMGVTDSPHSITPKVNLLSNGDLSVMVTNSGGGYTRWRNFDVTRWRSDFTSDKWGNFCYIKDTQTQSFWSTAFHPTCVKGRQYSVSFKADKVEIRRRDHQIETTTEIVVSPDDNAEIRLITLGNLSKKRRSLDITSYYELALAPHQADRAHPAFNKFFIEIEAVPMHSALLAFRRQRAPEDPQIWAGHILAQTHSSSIQFEIDRGKFIGRGKSLVHPQAIHSELSNTDGTPLDPIFSLRTHIVLEPSERIQIALVTVVSDNRETTLNLLKKYSDISATHRAFEMAWTHAQLELRHLKIHQEEAQLYQKLASRILYPHAQLRPSVDRLRRNFLGQSRLWAYGISGDLPLIVVSIADMNEVDFIRQILTAHTFWRMRGLKTDLVILNEEAASYEHPLFEKIKRIIQSQTHRPEVDKPGGVYLRNIDVIPEEDLILILAAASVNLIAARGSLRQQLVAPLVPTTCPALLHPKKGIKESPSPSLPFLELAYFNGTGGFTQDGREYAIYLGPNVHTPAPWCNVLANPTFGTLVSEHGLGCTWFGNSQTNRLTNWSNDPTLDPITDAIYIRDDESGTYWSPTPGPIREHEPYRVNHGQGYTRFEHNSHGISQELLVFVPVDDAGGLSMRIQRLKLKNTGRNPRALSIFSYTELVLGTDREETQLHVITEWDAEGQSMMAYNRYHPNFGSYVAFAASTPLPTSYSGNRTEFLGRNHHPSHPQGLRQKVLSNLTGGALDNCTALQVKIELAPDEETEVIFVLGYAENPEAARKLIGHSRDKQWIENTYRTTIAWWDTLLGKLHVETPDQALNFYLNRWLLYQNLSCRVWGRSGFYQSSGAYGFRDQLQDVMALTYAAPHIAKDQILKAASRQFIEGDVQHWWLPPSNAGVRTRISDDLLWLPLVTAHYLKVTKDFSILDEQIPFIKGDFLKDDQVEYFGIPEVTEEKASLLEHCRRAINKGITSGPHGLPLIGSGDWNDGMNHVGIHGKGESVWLGWFLITVMNEFADILAAIGQNSAGDGFKAEAKRLAETIETQAWDGSWYKRAYFDDGTPLGSRSNTEDFIDSLPQSWAVISGAADPQRANEAMEAVEKYLVKIEDKMILLLTPPFDKAPYYPGYIKGYPPGIRENGGQYTHGSLWVPLAFAKLGQADKAAQLLSMMLPQNHALTKEDVEKFKVEPYVMTGDIYSLPGNIGRGGWSWYTGSTSWMYRIWIEEMIGFTLEGDVLLIKPNLPKTWKSVQYTYQFFETKYKVHLTNEEGKKENGIKVELNGVRLEGNVLKLTNDKATHQIKVYC